MYSMLNEMTWLCELLNLIHSLPIVCCSVLVIDCCAWWYHCHLLTVNRSTVHELQHTALHWMQVSESEGCGRILIKTCKNKITAEGVSSPTTVDTVAGLNRWGTQPETIAPPTHTHPLSTHTRTPHTVYSSSTGEINRRERRRPPPPPPNSTSPVCSWRGFIPRQPSEIHCLGSGQYGLTTGRPEPGA